MFPLPLSDGQFLFPPPLSHTHMRVHRVIPRAFHIAHFHAVLVAICADVWLYSQAQQHTQSPVICSKPNVHSLTAKLTPCLLTNTHQHSVANPL